MLQDVYYYTESSYEVSNSSGNIDYLLIFGLIILVFMLLIDKYSDK